MWPPGGVSSAALSLILAVAPKMPLPPATRLYGRALRESAMKGKLNLAGEMGTTHDAVWD